MYLDNARFQFLEFFRIFQIVPDKSGSSTTFFKGYKLGKKLRNILLQRTQEKIKIRRKFVLTI